MNEKKSVAVIGAGPGGYETAIRLNRKGIDVVLFEKSKLGGECLNWGCIPTKAMVKSAELFGEIQHVRDFGIEIDTPSLNFRQLMKRKSEVVERLTAGLQHIFKKRQIPIVPEEVISITGKEKPEQTGDDNDTFEIKTKEGNSYSAGYIVIATGSRSMELPFLPFDGDFFLSSRHILDLQTLPEHLTILGGGTIGCEFASIFSTLGVRVEIIEMLPALLSYEDKEIARKLTMSFKKRGIAIHTNTKVVNAGIVDDKVKVETDNGKSIISDKLLISTGRVPNCKIDFGNLNVKVENERIDINESMETGQKNIYAIGDVTGKLMLAHTASKQGLLVADIIEAKINQTAKSINKITYCNIPRCTFTDPELASVGLTEQQVQDSGEEYLAGKFSYLGNGKALAQGCKDGFIKVIAGKQSRKLLGMHIIGSSATELIALGSVMINVGITLDELHKVVYAHPTLSEVVLEAIEDLDNMAIHKI